MQIILVTLRAIFPCFSFKQTVPVVWQLPVLSITPDVIITVWIIPAFLAFQKPRMLIGSMVDYQIHDHLQSQAVRLIQHLLKLLQIPIIRVDIFIVGNIIAIICIRRRIERRKPYAVHTKRFYVRQFFVNAVQIADSVSVSIIKTSDPDLVKCHSFVPIFFHTDTSFYIACCFCICFSLTSGYSQPAFQPLSMHMKNPGNLFIFFQELIIRHLIFFFE